MLLTKSRRLGELAMEQGILAGLTPLCDVAGLGDNLPLLFVAAIVVFRASIDPQRSGGSGELGSLRGRPRPGWTTLVWGVGALYILYRAVSRAAGYVALPMGGCLIVEAVLVPLAMLIVDGLLLAWLLVEAAQCRTRRGGRKPTRSASGDRPVARRGPGLRGGAAGPLCGHVRLAGPGPPAHFDLLNRVGRLHPVAARLGTDQPPGRALVIVGLVGVVAWTRGRIGEAVAGYWRLLAADGAHLVFVLAMAAVAATALSATAYAIVLLLPVQNWVLGAADAYAHFATLPVGLWTLAALIELAGRSLPTATLAPPAARRAQSNGEPEREAAHQEALPPVAAPAS